MMKTANDPKQAINTCLNRTVLLVEDVENMRVATARMLIDMGFKEVIQARNGLEALNSLAETPVDIIISDWLMAKMDGITLLQNIRKDPSTRELPFVMSTTLVEQENVIAAIKAGVSEYVAKPFNFDQLAKHIESAFTNPLNKRLKTAKSTGSSARVERRKSQNNFVVLLVADVGDDSQTLADVLKPQVRVKLASSGKKALALCHSHNPPDLILLDTTAINFKGFKLLEIFKSNAQTEDIPVILVIASERPGHIARGFALGAGDYISKPITAAEVDIRIQHQKQLWQYQRASKGQLATVIENFKMREDLDRMVQHDLHHSMAAIIALAEDSHRYANDVKRVDDNTQSILSTANMVNSMVSNLLTIIKIEDGNYTIERLGFSLLEVLQQVVATFDHQIKAKNLQVALNIDAQTQVSGEQSITYSLFSNLFINAVEAAPKGSQITISEQAVSDQNAGEHIEVVLNNLGAVPELLRSRFFEKYATTNESAGAGIGKYAAKLFCQIQQGSLAVHFAEDATRLVVRLCK